MKSWGVRDQQVVHEASRLPTCWPPHPTPTAATVGADGRLTLPAEARRARGLKPGASVSVEVDGNIVHLGRRESAADSGERELGRLRGTIHFEGDIVGPTEPDGREPREL